MKGKVLALHDGFHLDVIQGGSIPPKAVVQFENGMTLMVDERAASLIELHPTLSRMR